MPMLGGFGGADINGGHPTYRLAGKLRVLRDGGVLASDDPDMVEAKKRGHISWNGSAWALTPQGTIIVEQLG